MKKQRIVLASVLKPIDDTRMFEKIGKSLSRNPNYQIFIVGYPSKSQPTDPKIQFIPHTHFKRLSLKRLFLPLLILKKIAKVKPDAVIVNTHELLIVTILYRILFGAKLIYDIQENYWRNILWTNTYPAIFRQILAVWVRSKEVFLSPLFSLFLLAEKGFEKEMSFFKKKFVILENKGVLPANYSRSKVDNNINLLFSGTISESTGVFQAIELARRLHNCNNQVRLHIIGYCSLSSTLHKIKELVQNDSFITITGGDQLIPHKDIIHEIAHSDFGIIYYPQSPHIENKIPTKLYEYLSAQLPILIQPHSPWIELCKPYHAAIAIDFNSPIDAPALLLRLMETKFYTIPPVNMLWLSEEDKLVEAMNKIFA